MSNYYTHFSVFVELKNQQEKDWFKVHLNFMTLLEEKFFEESEMPEHYKDGQPISSEARLWEHVPGTEGDGEVWGFQYRIRDDRDDVWFYCEESGAPWQVAAVIHQFLKDMRPDTNDVFYVSWSDTCDKLKPDGFGGGTMSASKIGVGVCNHTDQEEYALAAEASPWK